MFGSVYVGALINQLADPEIEGIRFSEKGFRLKKHEKSPDAPLSPYFFNLRVPGNPKPGKLTPELVYGMGQAMYNTAWEAGVRNFDRVVPVPNAGDPFAEVISAASSRLPLRLRKETAGDGTRCIAEIDPEEFYKPGQVALLVDDLITGADSKVEAINILRGVGLVVEHAVVFLDREQGGREELARIGVTLHTCVTVTEVMEHCLGRGLITPATYALFRNYLAAERAEAGLL